MIIPSELDYFNTIKDKCKIIFDIGCRDDMTYIKLAPELEHYLFEPNISFYNNLLENLKSNDYKNVHTYNFGLGNISGLKQYYLSFQSFIYRTIGVHCSLDTGKVTDYPIERFDTFLIDNNITHIDFLKMDIEGMEPDILLHFQDEIKTKVDFVQFEYGSTWRDRDDTITLTDIMREYSDIFNFYALSPQIPNNKDNPFPKTHPDLKTLIDSTEILDEIENCSMELFYGFDIVMERK
jgi:FkbM family methyltransferase